MFFFFKCISQIYLPVYFSLVLFFKCIYLSNIFSKKIVPPRPYFELSHHQLRREIPPQTWTIVFFQMYLSNIVASIFFIYFVLQMYLFIIKYISKQIVLPRPYFELSHNQHRRELALKSCYSAISNVISSHIHCTSQSYIKCFEVVVYTFASSHPWCQTS